MTSVNAQDLVSDNEQGLLQLYLMVTDIRLQWQTGHPREWIRVKLV